MATWHQQQRPTHLWHTTEWTVVVDPPNEMRTLMRFTSKALADVYMRGLKANNPHVARHSYILRPAK